MNWGKRICTLDLSARVTELHRQPQPPVCPTRQRLAESFDRLQDIDAARSRRGDPLLAKFAEVRIVWRELLDLELQDVDEQSGRILAAAEDPSAYPDH